MTKNTLATISIFLSAIIACCHSFTPMVKVGKSHNNAIDNRSTSQIHMGFFDDLNLIFSEEGRKNRAEYEGKDGIDKCNNSSTYSLFISHFNLPCSCEYAVIFSLSKLSLHTHTCV